MTINETLRKKRIELGISQKFVGDNIKEPQSTLCRFEQGFNTTKNQLLIHKLMKFYSEYEGAKSPRVEISNKIKATPKKKNNIESETAKAIEKMGKEVEAKINKIFAEEIEKSYKKIIKSALKRIVKEL